MRSAGKARTVAYVSVGVLALTAVVAGAAVALTRDDTDQPATLQATVSAPIPATTASAPPAARRVAPVPSRTRPAATPPSTRPVSLTVPQLHRLTPPDAIVSLRHAAAPHQLRLLRRATGVHHVFAVDRGWLTIRHQRLRTYGVPLGMRGLTPSLTASSRPLWDSIARGELTVGYANAKNLRHHLGATFPVTGPRRHTVPLRIGAFATLGLDRAQALLSRSAATAAGLRPDRVAVVVAPKISLDALTAAIRHAFGRHAQIDVTRPTPVNQAVASTLALSRIPASYLDLYRRAAVTCPGLPWTVLAGIGTVETGNGANVHRSSAGAEGPMQFLPSTWAMYGYDADGDGKADIQDPTDAVFSAARYLCAAGAGRGGQSLAYAIYAYNHAWWYVREVVAIARTYA